VSTWGRVLQAEPETTEQAGDGAEAEAVGETAAAARARARAVVLAAVVVRVSKCGASARNEDASRDNSSDDDANSARHRKFLPIGERTSRP
jgi:hypothetical protein